MVLWEITLGTAYFLGLKRSYRLALRIQRRIKHPKIRQFLQRRTRAVFDVALKCHRNIQERDIEVGRNLGNWILRCLDRIKPSAEIRRPPPGKPSNGSGSNANMTKAGTTFHMKPPGSMQTQRNWESDRHRFTSSAYKYFNPLPTLAMMVGPPRPPGSVTQYRHFSGPQVLRPSYPRSVYEGVVRADIMQWMLRN